MGKRSVRYAMIDAFTGVPFKGNPAALCLLNSAEDAAWMQSFASEFNISDTAFLLRAVEGSGDPAGGASRPRFNLSWFTPAAEDPVCGSAHCILAPYWSKKLGNSNLIIYMASPRSGILDLHFVEETQRVYIRGEAVTVMVGTLVV